MGLLDGPTPNRVSLKPTPIFLCDDYAGDVDATHKTRVITTLHNQRQVTLVGYEINATNYGTDDGVAALDALLTYDGLPGLPIGYTPGPALIHNSYFSPAMVSYPHTQTSATAPSGVTALRRALAGRPSRDLVIESSGFLTGIAALLNSPADGISPLTGPQLVAAKCKQLVVMGGYKPAAIGSNTAAEFNLHSDIPASQTVFGSAAGTPGLWPSSVPILQVPYEIGVNTTVGQTVAATCSPSDPMYASLVSFGKIAGQNAYDPVSALIAAVGPHTLGLPTTRGTAYVDSGGILQFTEGVGNFAYCDLPQQYATLSTAVTAGTVTSLQVSAPLTPGSTLTIDTGSGAETVTPAANGLAGTANPYTLTIASQTLKAHSVGARIAGYDPAAITALQNTVNALLTRRAPIATDPTAWSPA